MSVVVTAAPRRVQPRGDGGLALLVVRRLLVVPLVLLVLATLVFLAMRIIPGDPARTLAVSGTSGLSNAQIQANEARATTALGLDRPLWAQYLTFLSDLVRLHLGQSFFGSSDVLGLIESALPVTLELTVAAMLLAVVLGTLTGLLAAVRQGTWVDAVIQTLATVSFSLPWFALGVVAIVVFGVWLGALPVIGRLPNSLGYQPTTNVVLVDAVLQGRPDLIVPWLTHLILPATTLALSMAGYITRTVRAAVLEVLGDDFVRTARMKGVSEGAILGRHVLRNASLPVVTVLGLQFGSLLGGSLITESLFSYPGIGSLLVHSVNQRDYPVVQGAALAIALLFTLVNAAVDLGYLVLDPRLRRA